MTDLLERFRAMPAADQARALHSARTADLRRALVAYLRYEGRPMPLQEIRAALSRRFDAAGVRSAAALLAALDEFAGDRRRPRLRWTHGPRLSLCKSVNGEGTRP